MLNFSSPVPFDFTAMRRCRINVVLLAVVLGLVGCNSRPVLKKPDPNAISIPINTPEAAAQLKLAHTP